MIKVAVTDDMTAFKKPTFKMFDLTDAQTAINYADENTTSTKRAFVTIVNTK
jgi:hypothetical protein